jgi:uncharacterized membrane protein YbhN (UPF0104 family)
LKFKKSLILSLFFGFAVFLALLFYADLHELKSHLSGFIWYYFLIALILAFLNYFIRYLRWEFYLRRLNISIERKKSFAIFFTGLALSITPGKAGEGVKSILLKTIAGIPIAFSLPIFFSERILDVLGVSILLSFGLQIFQQGFPIFFLSLGISLLLILLFLKSPLILTRLPLPNRVMEWVKVFAESGSHLLSLKNLIPMLFLTLLAWFAECIAFFLILKGLGISETVLFATFTYSLSTLAGAVTFLPGGLGATEASLVALLILRDIAKPLAVSATLLVRVATLWFAILIGGLIFFFSRKTLLNPSHES